MNHRRALIALTLCLSLAVWTLAQNPPAALPGTPLLPVVPTVPPPPSFPRSGGPTHVPGVQYQEFAPLTTIPATPSITLVERPREMLEVPARIELSDGTTLSGEIHSDGPLQCTALFGPTAIPINQIRGIEWRTMTNQQGEQERKATLILLNGDVLTVSVTIPTIQVKTRWGHATVDLPHVRSIIMTVEKVKWADAPDGRRVLVPDGDATHLDTLERETRQ